MEHCYIFNYNSPSIYHVILPDDIKDTDSIEAFLRKTYNFKSNYINFLVSDKPLTIEEL